MNKLKKYVVCMDASYVRDAQMFDSRELTDDVFDCLDMSDEENDQYWCNMEPNPFNAIVEANDEAEACEIAGKQKKYDPRTLYAISV